MKQWRLRLGKTSDDMLREIVRCCKVSPAVAQILAVRGYNTPQKAAEFLDSGLNSLYDPSLMKDMDKGCAILLAAIKEKQPIIVFGDYDVDGITSTSILVLVLRRLGAVVDYYIPQREQEGYGLNSEAVRLLAAQGTQVLLTCDNGISAFEQVALAKELGMSVVIADHHEVSFASGEAGPVYLLPDADAIINPKQQDCPYPFKALCAAGIAYKMAQKLYSLTGAPWPRDADEYLSLAVVATVCDIMEMQDENRVLLRYGLPLLPGTPNLGLKMLIKAAGLEHKELNVYHLGFIIGPCINASGRMELAHVAVELFLTSDLAEAERLAGELVDMNNMRKTLSNEGFLKASAAINAAGLEQNKVILVHVPELNESIAGIVAGRLKENFGRPAIVLAGTKRIVRGSGRSIEACNMFEALMSASDLLETFGGHPMAAGLSVRQENITALRARLNENCHLTIEEMTPVIYIDLQLPIEKVNLDLAQELQRMEPCGRGNERPLFGDKGVGLTRVQLLGEDENVVRLYFSSRYGRGNVAAVMFRQRAAFESLVLAAGGERLWQQLLDGYGGQLFLDIVYAVELNNYNDRLYPQIHIRDFRLSQCAK